MGGDNPRTFDYLGMAYKDSDYTDVIHELTQTHNFGAETYFGGGDTSAFGLPFGRHC